MDSQPDTLGGRSDPDLADLSGSVLYDRAGRRFQLIRMLGQGGFGTVYRARVRSPGGLELEVALKLLRDMSEAEPQQKTVERLLEEASLLARMRHPVIVAAHDLAWFGKRPALIVEYVDGADLKQLLQDKRHPLPLSGLLAVVGQVASALDAAFATCGIVHRDVKPENIRIARHGNVKLLDFGIARSAEITRETDLSTTTGVLGSLHYLAPERFDLARAPHPASDIYALGCVLYEGISLQGLLRGLEIPQLLALAHRSRELDALVASRLAIPMPPDLRALLAAMLAWNTDARPDAAQVTARCERLCNLLPEPITLRAWCREHSWPADSSTETEVTDLLQRPAPLLPDTVIRARPAPEPMKIEVVPYKKEEPVSSAAKVGASASMRTMPAPREAGWAPWVGIGLAALLPAALLLFVVMVVAVLALGPWHPLMQGMQETQETQPPLPLPAPAGVLPAPVASPRALLPSAPPEPSGSSPARAPSAPQLLRVIFAGPVGATLYVDGIRLGETNLLYEVSVGDHVCGVGYGVIEAVSPCAIPPETRMVMLPDVPTPGSVSSGAPIELE